MSDSDDGSSNGFFRLIIIYIDENNNIYLKNEKPHTDILSIGESVFFKNAVLNKISEGKFKINKLYHCNDHYVCSIIPSYFVFSNIPSGWNAHTIDEITNNNDIDKKIKSVIGDYVNGNRVQELDMKYQE